MYWKATPHPIMQHAFSSQSLDWVILMINCPTWPCEENGGVKRAKFPSRLQRRGLEFQNNAGNRLPEVCRYSHRLLLGWHVSPREPQTEDSGHGKRRTAGVGGLLGELVSAPERKRNIIFQCWPTSHQLSTKLLHEEMQNSFLRRA